MSNNYPEEIYSELSIRIKEICSDKKVKPIYLIDNGLATNQTVYNILNNKQRPGIDFAVKFLHLFTDVDGDWLLTGRGEKYRSLNTSGNTVIKGSKITGKEAVFGFKENKKTLEHYQELLNEKDNRITDLKKQIDSLQEQVNNLFKLLNK